MSHRSINPYGIVSIGPDLDFLAPHGRDQMSFKIEKDLEISYDHDQEHLTKLLRYEFCSLRIDVFVSVIHFLQKKNFSYPFISSFFWFIFCISLNR